MVSLIDIAIVVLAGTSLFLIAKNMLFSRDVLYPLQVSETGRMEVEIDNRRYKGVAFLADKVLEGDRLLAERIGEIARSLGVSVTLVSTAFAINKGRLLSHIDDELKRAELAYESSKHIRYLERTKFLRELYKRVLTDYRPLVGSLAVVVWVPDREPVKEVAGSFRALLEAETGVSFREVEVRSFVDLLRPPSIEDSLKLKPIMISSSDFHEPLGVVLGRRAGEHSVVTLSWPGDFEAHVGVFGPTGRGKSVLLAGIAAQLGIMSDLSLDPHMVLVLDPKGDLTRLLLRVATRVNKVRKSSCIPFPSTRDLALKLLDSSRETSWTKSVEIYTCQGSLLERGLVVYDLSELESSERNVAVALALSSLIVEAEERGLAGRVVVVIDEAWRISTNVAFHLTLAAREGRSKKLHLIYATQSPTDVPPIVLDNTRTAIVFGGFTKNYTEFVHRLGIPSPEDLLRLPVGHAFLKIGDRPPVLISVYNFEEWLNRDLLKRTDFEIGKRNEQTSSEDSASLKNGSVSYVSISV
ncbi:MAG: DUF87 domain-containing protein [Acidilobaceae archaeon]